ncbi:MAG: hypothetical protein ACTSU5_10600 [Promethearchaeota archaeon]
MSELQKIVQSVVDRFADFRGCIELENFTDFLLFNSSSEAPDNIMGMLGMGQKQDIILTYDQYRDIFFSRVVSGPQDSNSLVVYVRRPAELDDVDELLDKFRIEVKDPFLDRFFTKKERELYFARKKHIFFVAASDYNTLLNFSNAGVKPEIRVENYFPRVLGLVAGFGQAKSVFILKGDPTIAFNFNFSLFSQVEHKNGSKFLIDCHADADGNLEGKTFIEVTEDFEVKFLEKVDVVDFKHQYTMIVPIKSFDVPH